jgi:hypothetical protein
MMTRFTTTPKRFAAVAVRDAALSIVNWYGRTEPVRSGHITIARVYDFIVLYDPLMPGRGRLIDVWLRNKKVFSAEWGDGENLRLINFRRGDWETPLLAMGNHAAKKLARDIWEHTGLHDPTFPLPNAPEMRAAAHQRDASVQARTEIERLPKLLQPPADSPDATRLPHLFAAPAVDAPGRQTLESRWQQPREHPASRPTPADRWHLAPRQRPPRHGTNPLRVIVQIEIRVSCDEPSEALGAPSSPTRYY